MLFSRESTGYLLGLAGVIMFAGTLPATRLAVASLPPWFVTCGRAAIAGLLATALLLLLRRPWPNPGQMRLIAISGVMVLFGFPGMIALAMTTVPAAHGGIVLGLLPIMTAALSAWRSNERPGFAFWVLSFLGAAVVVGYTFYSGADGLEAGDGFLVLAAMAASTGYVYGGDLSTEMPGWEAISWICALFLPITAAASLLLMPADFSAVSVASWWGFAYAALISQFIGFFAWNAGLAMGGVTRVSQVQFLQTFFTLGFAALINGESVGRDAVIAACVIVGILLAMRKLRMRG